MWKFWKRDRDELELERELRANRPQPSADFVKSLAAEISEASAPAPARRVKTSRRPAFRLAPVMGLTILCLIGAGAFGGAAIANGGGKDSKHEEHGEHHGKKDDDDHGKPDHHQYDKRTVMCHRPNSKHPHTIRVGKNGVAKHLAAGDTLGPCPKGHHDDDDDHHHDGHHDDDD